MLITGGYKSTERVRLARLAEATLAAVPQVTAATDPDGRWVTDDAGHLIRCVVAVAEPSGRVEVVLHAAAVWPAGPLEELGERVRDHLCRAADAAGLGDALGSVEVCFHDVVEPVAYPEAA